MADGRIMIPEIDHARYDFRYDESSPDYYREKDGFTEDIVRRISDEKGDPDWMRLFRLKCLDLYSKMDMPCWGPPIDELDMDRIASYVRHKSEMKSSWNDVPADIKETFERLGIPQAERLSLAGVGAQYDSEIVYHHLREEVAKSGVIYTDIETAIRTGYEDVVREHFMKLVPPTDHKYAALHGAVWSGGSFVYVPP